MQERIKTWRMRVISPDTRVLSVKKLQKYGEHAFRIEANDTECLELANNLGLLALRKLRFEGLLQVEGRAAWVLRGKLGATATQECVVSLAPVTSRIDDHVTRRFVDALDEAYEPGSETPMPEDDSIEELGEAIDLIAVLGEALALALPAYPRAEGAEIEGAQAAPPGVTPISDDEVKPFAGLADLKEKLKPNNEV